MNMKNELVEAIVEGLRNVKANDITWLDLTDIEQRALDDMVLCSANTAVQIRALAEEVEAEVKKQCHVSPIAVHGLDNAQWVAIDYGHAMVHVMTPEARTFYDIDSLWGDAKTTHYTDEF